MITSPDERKLQPVFGRSITHLQSPSIVIDDPHPPFCCGAESVAVTDNDEDVLTRIADIEAGGFKIAESTINRHLKKTPKSPTALVARLVLRHAEKAPDSAVLEAFNAVRRARELSPLNFWRVERTLKEMLRCKSLPSLLQGYCV